MPCAADPSKPQRWHLSERDLDKLPIERRRSSWLHNNDRYLKCTASDGAGARQHWERHDQMLANNMTLCEGPVSRVVCARSRGRDKNLARWCVFYGLHANLAVTGAPMLTLFCTPSQGLRSLITTTGPMGHLTKKLNPFEPSFGLVDVVADRSRWPRVAAPRDARVAVLQLGDCGTALAAPTAAKSGNPGHCSADWLNFAFAARTAAHAGLLAPAGAEDASGGGFLPLLLRGYGWARPDGRHYFHDLWHALALPLAPGPTAVELPSRGADATSCVARSAAVLSRHAPLLGGHKPAPHRDAAIVRAGLRTPSDGGDGGGDGASAGVARWVRLDGVSLPNPWTSMRWPKGPCVSAFLSPVAAAFRDRATPHMDATLLPRANASLLQSAAQRLARGGANFHPRDGIIFLVRCGTLSSHSVRCINNRVQIFEALVAAFPERTVVTRPGVMAQLHASWGLALQYYVFRCFGVVVAMHSGGLGLSPFMSPGQALVEIHPERKTRKHQGHAQFESVAVGLGVTYRAVFAGGTWKGLASPSGDVPVDLVLAAAQDAAAAAPRDRDRLLALVSS